VGQSSFHFILYQEGFEVEIELKVFRKGILGVGVVCIYASRGETGIENYGSVGGERRQRDKDSIR